MAYRLGIDFGTCFTYVACAPPGEGPERINVLIDPVHRTPYEIPTVFYHRNAEGERFCCGFDAVPYADYLRGSADEPAHVVRHVKQLLLGPARWGAATAPGDTYVTQPSPDITLADATLSPRQVVTYFLSYVRELAAEALRAEDHNVSTDVLEAVLAVPAVFTEQERAIILAAAQDAGLHVLGLIDEPVAIAIDYIEHLSQKTDTTPLLVYDLGGGTIDVACLRYHPTAAHDITVPGGTRITMAGHTTYEVIASTGARIGGVMWDNALGEHMLARCQEAYQAPPIHDPALPFYRRVTEAKHQLTRKESIDLPFTYMDAQHAIAHNRTLTVTRADFNHITEDLLQETLACLRTLTLRCGLKSGSPVRVVLSGGSSRMPQVREGVLRVLEQELGLSVVNRTKMLYRHEKAVALGAARYAHSLPAGPLVPLTSVYGVALRNAQGRMSQKQFLIAPARGFPPQPVPWQLSTKNENEAEIVIIERYDKVQGYVAQTDRLQSIRLQFDTPLPPGTPLHGTLALSPHGVLSLSLTHPVNGTTETRCVCIHSFPSPRARKNP